MKTFKQFVKENGYQTLPNKPLPAGTNPKSFIQNTPNKPLPAGTNPKSFLQTLPNRAVK